jgi:uncharacterized protein (DUF1684 family)
MDSKSPRIAAALAAAVLAMAPTRPAAAPEDPAASWREWRARREERLRAPEGWLALVGLHWLAEGDNRVPGLPGLFVLRGGEVTLEAAKGDGYQLDGVTVAQRALLSDAAPRPDRLRVGTRTVQVIVRAGAVALRVWDRTSPSLRTFHGLSAFPYDPRLRVEARWEAYPQPREVEQPSAAGPPQRAMAPGRAHFTLDGQEWSLEPTEDDDALLFVFKDATAPKETYGAGRFLVAELPRDGKVLLDFNRAFNPPCAFTPYATCPLPERQNVLPVRIAAGERKYGDH